MYFFEPRIKAAVYIKRSETESVEVRSSNTEDEEMGAIKAYTGSLQSKYL